MELVLTAVVGAYVVINSLGVLANILVIILIYTSTPVMLQMFSLLLLNMAIIDFIANGAGLLSIPRLLPIGDAIVILSHGLCQFVSHDFCLVSYCTMVSFHIHSTLCLPISFLYRWWILSRPAPSKMVILGAILFVLPLSSVEFASCLSCLNDDVKETLNSTYPLITYDHDLLIGFRSLKNAYAAQTVFYLSFVFPVVYCIVFVIRRRVLRTLENAGLAYTTITHDMHKTLLMVLTLQAIIPLGLLFCSIQYLYIQLIDSDVVLMQYLALLPMNCVSLIQPLITLYFVVPYRQALTSMFEEMDHLLTAVMGAYLFVNTAGIAANLTVIILIYTSTPNNLKLFSLLLLNMAVIDFIANCAGIFSIPRLQPIGNGLVIISHGLCKYLSHGVCLVSYCTMVSFHIHSTLSLPISFFYRWWILSHRAPSKMVIIVALIAVTPLSSMEFTSCLRCLGENVTELVENSSQLHNSNNGVLIGFRTFKNIYAVQTMFYLSFVFPIVYCIVFVIRRRVLKTLESAGLSHAAVSYDMHKKLLMVLTLQAVVPLGLMLCGLQYFYSQLIDQNVVVMQYLTVLPMNCVSLIQPLITLYYVAPYRKALSNVFGTAKPILRTSLWTTTHVTTVHTVTVQHKRL